MEEQDSTPVNDTTTTQDSGPSEREQALERQVAQLKARLDKQAESSAKSESDWKALAEQRQRELDEAKTAASEHLSRAQRHVLESHVLAQLASHGITDPEMQAILMPGIIAKTKSKVTSDFQVQGDFTTAIQKVASTLTPPKSAMKKALKASGSAEEAPKQPKQDRRAQVVEKIRLGLVGHT